ncbi:MAG: magnesium transporter NIPA-domain-containing protein [Benjaminiella poitrasii]|nr:MAG: magnesium transporter NIPA-domain-containing protein [Benjaminiella poitrasii]
MFWIGLGVSVITNLVQAFSLAYQRKSHLINDMIFPKELRKKSYQRPMWLIAFISFIVANTIGSIFSIGYLPIVILAPIGAMNLVMNAFAANIVLGDPFTRTNILGTGFIVVGALLVGFFGVIPEPHHSLNDLIELYKKSSFIAYFSILEILIVTLIIISYYCDYQLNTGKKMYYYGYQVEKIKRWIGISYGVLSGNISSQSMLFAKSGIELIILSVNGDNQLQYPLTWFLLVMMILTGAMQLYYLNKGLQLCDNMILIPVSFCSFNLSCLFNGLVYYGQWHLFSWSQLLNVALGVGFTIWGVILLSLQKRHAAVVGMTTTTTGNHVENNRTLNNDNDDDDDIDGNDGTATTALLSETEREYIILEQESRKHTTTTKNSCVYKDHNLLDKSSHSKSRHLEDGFIHLQ